MRPADRIGGVQEHQLDVVLSGPIDQLAQRLGALRVRNPYHGVVVIHPRARRPRRGHGHVLIGKPQERQRFAFGVALRICPLQQPTGIAQAQEVVDAGMGQQTFQHPGMLDPPDHFLIGQAGTGKVDAAKCRRQEVVDFVVEQDHVRLESDALQLEIAHRLIGRPGTDAGVEHLHGIAVGRELLLQLVRIGVAPREIVAVARRFPEGQNPVDPRRLVQWHFRAAKAERIDRAFRALVGGVGSVAPQQLRIGDLACRQGGGAVRRGVREDQPPAQLDKRQQAHRHTDRYGQVLDRGPGTLRKPRQGTTFTPSRKGGYLPEIRRPVRSTQVDTLAETAARGSAGVVDEWQAFLDARGVRGGLLPKHEN